MNKVFYTGLVLMTACNGPVKENGTSAVPTTQADTAASAWHHVELPGLDDNVKSDTLLIQTTFKLPDGRFVMVAGPMDEASREGLHLYLYKPTVDSAAKVIARSKPGYDSYTMLPTFFATDNAADGLVLLANMGERDSWGQEVFWLKDDHFVHLGFLDVALRSWKSGGEGPVRVLSNIAPKARVAGAAGAFTITFDTDSVFLYDDLQGHAELMLPSSRVGYCYAEGNATLLLDGKPVLPKQPA
jgi:hypothetical protein